EVRLHFSQFHLVQEIENAFEDSLWTQAGTLIIHNRKIAGKLPEYPCQVQGGDLTNNIFTYRDHAPLPIDWTGEVGCSLRISGTDHEISITGSGMQLELHDFPRYLRHIKKS
ncbi:MAG: hypothetical protein PVJ15_05995, partial [Gammaproteobacteria bacterium]